MKKTYYLLFLTFLLSLHFSVGCSAKQQSESPQDVASSLTATPQSGLIDRVKLLSHVETLASDAFQGRQTGTEGGAMARSYVLNEMVEMGLKPCSETLEQPFSFISRRTEQETHGVNLIGFIPGTEASAQVIAVTAHFDHLGVRDSEIFNGADDNASGTAALLEIARYFIQHPPTHGMIIGAVDAEEMGLQGARALVDSPCVTQKQVALNINMDMISRSEAGELYVSGTRHYPDLRPVVEVLSLPEGVTLKFGHDEPGTGSDDWTMSSDHGPFHQKGIPFLYFGVEDHPGYHNPTDDYSAITPDFYVGAVNVIVRAIEALDGHLSMTDSQ